MPNPDLMSEYMRLIGFILLLLGLAAPSLSCTLFQDARMRWKCRDWHGVIQFGSATVMAVAACAVALIAGIVMLFGGVQV